MATIHKRRLVSGNVAWELCHGSGRDRQRFVAGKTREEAQEVLNQFNRQVALHGSAPTDDSVAAVLGQYFVYLEGNRRDTTRRRYVRVLQTFHRRFLEPHCPGVQRLRQITPAHIEEFKTRRQHGTLRDFIDVEADRRDEELRRALSQRPSAGTHQDNAKFGWLGRKRFKPVVAPRTINYELQVLRTFFRWAVKRNLLFVNPTALVERLRIPRQAVPKFLTSEELKRLFAACNGVERRLFMTILMTGMRRGEAQHLTWTDVNFELGVLFIQAKPQWNWKPKTTSASFRCRRRCEPSCSSTMRIVAVTNSCFPIGLATSIRTSCPSSRRSVARPACRTSRCTPCDTALERTCAWPGLVWPTSQICWAIENLATTQIYAKVQQEHLRTVIAKLTPVVVESPETSIKQIGARPSEDDADSS